MKSLGYLVACASLFVATTANAQDAASAFQCDLPYEAAMAEMGSLDVLEQKTVKPFPGLHGEGHLISFSPGGTSVYAAKPDKLTLEVLTPHAWQPKEKYVITFSSTFAKTAAADEAIQQSVKWHLGFCGALEFCIRSSESAPAGTGRLEYRRGSSLVLNCIFEFTPEEFDALGN